MNTSAGDLELWFDYSCPYAYLASRRARTLGVPIDWRPMLLGGVFRGIGAGAGPMATIGPAKAMHNVAGEKTFRPSAWPLFGGLEPQSADYRACANFGPIYGKP